MSTARFALFSVLLGALIWAANRYFRRWMVTAFALTPRGSRILDVVLYVALFGSVVRPFRPFTLIAASVELTVLLSLVPLWVVDITRWLLRRAAPSVPAPGAPKPESTTPSSQPLDPPAPAPIPAAAQGDIELPFSRRALLSRAAAGSAVVVAGTSSLYGTLRGRTDYAIETPVVRIPGLNKALDGYSIAQLSDLHIGQFTEDAELTMAEALVSEARPDLIVLTGDLIDRDAHLAERLGRFVRRLSTRARHGVVAIPGNHDYYAGIDEVLGAIRAASGRVLQNRGLLAGDPLLGKTGAAFALLGVDDSWGLRLGSGQGPQLEQALAQLPAYGGSHAAALDLPRVLLCHNPSYFEHAAGRVALQLSGHTHGGQVSPIVNPAKWVLSHGWVAGMYEHQGSRLYVNRGFGTAGPPARIGSRPELTKLILTAG